MIDPLVNFNFLEIYKQYDDIAPDYNNFKNEIEKMGIDFGEASNDRKLYYYIRKRFSHRSKINIYDYIALLFWKLCTNPQNAVWKNLLYNRRGINKNNEERNLKEVLDKFNPSEDYTLFNFSKTKFSLSGIQTTTSLPTRSTFLHFLYPETMPIFDRMVLRAVNENYLKGDNERYLKYSEYFLHVHFLSEKYKDRINQISNLEDTPIRIIEMALWIIR